MSRGLFEAGWEGLRLVVEQLEGYYRGCVYDPGKGEVLHTATRLGLDSAKLAVVEYAISNRFGARSDLKPEIVAEMLNWQQMG